MIFLPAVSLPSIKFGMAAEQLLQRILQARPDLSLDPIKSWAADQAAGSVEHDMLHYLETASQMVMRGDPLPWLAINSSGAGDRS